MHTDISLGYRKNLLNELRTVPFIYRDGVSGVTEEMTVKAVTLNENLMALGFTLTPEGILQAAVSPSLETLYEEIKECIGTVDAEPMYPDFPKQVMGMDEAVFRFCQLIHYASTYGMEYLTGKEILKGWLPDMGKTPKVKKDDRLLSSKAITLINAEDPDALYLAPMQKILGKRERMTLPEKEIVKYAAKRVKPEKFKEIPVPFKQNLMDLFYIVMETTGREEAFPILHSLCQHTGDVLKCADYCLTQNHYHFKTSQKKLLVKLLESYPEKDFKANLILSRKKGERSILLLQYLDYNMYSRSILHKEAVRMLRNGDLRSWESRAKYLLTSGDDGALGFIAGRPGMLLRMAAWLLRLGYKEEDIARQLTENAEALSAETIVTVLTKFSRESFGSDEKEAVIRIFTEVLRRKLGSLETPLKGKKVYIKMPAYDLAHSELRFNDRSGEGGYIRSGIAYRIPDDVRYLRFFVYWDDKHRVDVDLHANGTDKTGGHVNIGWDADFRNHGVIHSGDITHSDAAEYIDIDLNGGMREVNTSIHLFAGKPSFGEIENCFTGMMAVKKTGENVQLYDPANCFFSYNLKGNCRLMDYGMIDIEGRYLYFNGTERNASRDPVSPHEIDISKFTLATFLQMLLDAQGCSITEDKNDADLSIVMGKPSAAAEISLIDNHFFIK